MSSTSRGRKTGLIALSILVVIAIIIGCGEFFLRRTVANEIRDEVGTNATGEEASVSFGATPLLWSSLTGNIPRVEIDTPSTVQISHPEGQNYPEVTGTPKSHIIVTDLDSKADPAVAGSLRLETTINNDYIQAELQREFSKSLEEQEDRSRTDLDAIANSLLQSVVHVSSVSTDTAAGTMTVEFNDGLATVTLTPEIDAGKLSFDDVQSTVLGLELPTEVNESLKAAINSGLELQDAGLTFEKAEVASNGMHVVISGNNVVLEEIDISA